MTLDNETALQEHISTFSKRLNELRSAKSMSQDALAEATGLKSRQTIAGYETLRSTRLPDINALCKLCTALEVSPNYLLGYSDIAADGKKNYGLSDETINLLQTNPGIHQFFDYFVRELVANNLEQVLSSVGLTNNFEKRYETIYPADVLELANEAFRTMVKSASSPSSVSSDMLEQYFRKIYFVPKPFSKYFNEELKENGRNYFLNLDTAFNERSDNEQANIFIKTLCSDIFEAYLIQDVYYNSHRKLSKQIMDIINNYVQLLY